VSGPDRLPVREDLSVVAPYGAPQLDVRVRLNTNETAEAPPAAFGSAVRERMTGLDLHRYPDRRAAALRARLGETHGLPPERVWAANGSNEILQQLFLAYGGPGRRMLLFRPGYSMYPLLARITLTPVVEHDLPSDLVLTPPVAEEAVREHAPDLVVVAHPNNPTGIPVDLDSIRALHDASRGLVVVDEAYVEFGATSALGLLDELPRVVVSRTFSKAYRLAGLRLGYLLAHAWVIDDLRKVRLPYHLDTIKQIAGIVALDLGDEMLAHISRVAAERDRLTAELRARPGVEVHPSAANFLLLRTQVPDLFARLLSHGVLVRDFSSVPRLEGCLRVTIGTPAENDAFLDALEASLGVR
jgi:histidinol-phosphate aminotransferase